MSFFQFNYNKEGKGVEKNAPEKNAFFTGSALYIRNFWNLIKVNLLYALSSIPMIIILGAFFMLFLYPHLAGVISELTSGAEAVEAAQAHATYTGVFTALFVSEFLFMLGSGPASAYFAYAARCITREDHLWIWSDFCNKFKENFKQSLIVSVIDVVALFLMFNAGYFYFSMYKSSHSMLYFILLAFLAVTFSIYVFMHGYIYQMLVTFDNKLTTLYKNAFILAVAKLPQNFLLIAIPAVVTYFVFAVLNPVFALILLVLFWYAAMRFPIEFYAARTVKKIIDNNTAYAEQESEHEKGSEE